MQAKTILKSKVFYGAVTTILIGVFTWVSGDKTSGMFSIITGLGIIAARLNSNTKVYIRKPKTKI